MIDLEPQIQYPLFFNAGSKANWEALNEQADAMLGYSNDGAETYSNPIIDKQGDYWFTVNEEVSKLVNLQDCVNYNEIELKQIDI